MLDLSTQFGQRVNHQIESEIVIWLTTVDQNNTPQPRPVWFYWDGTTFLIYSQPKAHKVRHIVRAENVALHFSSDSKAHEVTVLTGKAQVDRNAPAADLHPGYLSKYREAIAGIGMQPSEMAKKYSVAIRVKPTRLRGF